MTSTTTELAVPQGRGTVLHLRRMALTIGSFLGAIGSRWHDIVDSGQLGPDAERMISRHTGART